MPSFNFYRWLKSFTRVRKKPFRRERPVTRLWVEHLETREAPAVFTWIGGSGANWSTPANWQLGTAPSANSVLADLVFGSLGAANINATNNIPGLVVNSITISNVNNYNLTGAAGVNLILGDPNSSGSGFINVTNNVSAAQVGMDMLLAGGGLAGNQQFFTVGSGSDLTISGKISGTPGSQISKQGTGTLFLTNDNSAYSGPLFIDSDAGIVDISNAKALGGILTSTVQTLTLNNATAATQFQLTFGSGPGSLTASNLPYTGGAVDAATIQNALNGLGNVTGPGGAVQVSLSSSTPTSRTFTLVFTGRFTGTNVATLVNGAVTAGPGAANFSPTTVAQAGGVAATFPAGQSQVTVQNNSSLRLANLYDVITNASEAASTVTITTPAAHNLAIGQNVVISGVSTPGYNGTFVVASTPTATTFTYTNPITGLAAVLNSGYFSNPVLNSVQLFGAGAANAGSLINRAGFNVWAGSVQMGSDTTFGIASGVLNISGVISDAGSGKNLTKIGIPSSKISGRLVLSNANTYRGTTTVSSGVLTIQNPFALGAVASAGTFVTSNATTGENATLQLEFVPPTAAVSAALAPYYTLQNPAQPFNLATNPYTGFTVPDYQLFLKTFGYQHTGNVTFGSNIITGIPDTSQLVVGMGIVGGGFPGGTTITAINSLNQVTVSAATPSTATATTLDFGSPAGTSILGMGALDNHCGNNTWSGPIVLSDISAFNSVPIVDISVDSFPAAGASATTTSLRITGVISDVNLIGAPSDFEKIGPGNLILEPSVVDGVTGLPTTIGIPNTYDGNTFVAGGSITLRDSQGLGTIAGSTSVSNGFALVLESNVGHVDSVTGTINRLQVDEDLFLAGAGLNNTGALRSLSGINTWTATVTSTGAFIGVDAEPVQSANADYFTNDYSLTIDDLTGTSVTKVQSGHLILPNANTFTGVATIRFGWITAQDVNALGSTNSTVPQGARTTHVIESGAALHLKPLVPGQSFSVTQNWIVQGVGITHPFGQINQAGAIENLAGDNTLIGNIQLIGQTGIGVEKLDQTLASALTLTGEISQRAPAAVFTLPVVSATIGAPAYSQVIDTGANKGAITINYSGAVNTDFRVYYGPLGTPGNALILLPTTVSGAGAIPVPYDGLLTNVQVVVNNGTPVPGDAWSYTVTVNPDLTGVPTGPQNLPPHVQGGIVKLGSQKLNLEGAGIYTGGVDIKSGVVRVLSEDALGAQTGNLGVTVQTGGALELSPTLAASNGGLVSGPSIWGVPLTLNGSGNAAFGDAPLTVLAKDNLWAGPIALNANIAISFEGLYANAPVNTMTAIFRDAAGLNSLSGAVGTNPTVDVATSTVGGFGLNAVQILTFGGSIIGGGFKLSYFDGVTTYTTADPSPVVQLPAIGAGSAGALIPGTTYYYVVSAVVAGVESTVSNEQSFLATAADNQVQLDWNNVAGATRYRIYRSTTSGVYSSASLIGNSGPSTFLDTGAASPVVQVPPVGAGGGGTLVSGTTYYYVVSAIIGGQETALSNERSFTATAADTRVTLDWNNVAGATGYRVYRSTTSGVYSTSSLLASPVPSTFLDTGAATSAPGPLTPMFAIAWDMDPNTLVRGIKNALVTMPGSPFTSNDINVSLTNPGINVLPNSRLVITGSLSDGSATTIVPGDLMVAGGGELLLTNASTFRGTTFISEGTLTIQDGQALGGSAIPGRQELLLIGAVPSNLNPLSPTKFSLAFNGSSTPTDLASALVYTGTQADALAIENALAALPTIGASNVRVVQNNPGGFLITFLGALASTALPVSARILTTPGSAIVAPEGGTVVANNAQLQIQGGITVSGESLVALGAGSDLQSAVQTFTVGASASPQSGTYQLRFEPDFSVALDIAGVNTTIPINYYATGGQIQAALQSLTNISSAGGRVTVIETNRVDAQTATYQVVFNGAFAGKAQPLLTVIRSAVPPTNPTGTTTVTNPVHVYQGGTESVTPYQWFNIGPAPIANAQVFNSTTNPPVPPQIETGRVTGIAVQQAFPNEMVISTNDGGYWRTQDGGIHWMQMTDYVNDPTFGDAVMFGGAIAVTPPGNLWPSNPDLVYFATGEGNNTTDSYYGSGVYARGLNPADPTEIRLLVDLDPSDPGGIIGNPLAGKAVNRIVVDPLQADQIFVAASDRAANGTTGNAGVWRWDGVNWANLTAATFPVINASYSDLFYHVANDVLWMAIGTTPNGIGNGVYSSTDFFNLDPTTVTWASGNFFTSPPWAPGVPFTLTLNSANLLALPGNLSVGSLYNYVFTAISAFGETTPSNNVTASAVVAAGAGQIDVTWTNPGAIAVGGYNLYRRVGAGVFRRVNTTPILATTFRDNVADINLINVQPPALFSQPGSLPPLGNIKIAGNTNLLHNAAQNRHIYALVTTATTGPLAGPWPVTDPNGRLQTIMDTHFNVPAPSPAITGWEFLPAPPTQFLGTGPNGKGFIAAAIVAEPSSGFVYVAGTDSAGGSGFIYQSTNFGATWTTDISNVAAFPNAPHSGVHSMVLDSANNLLVGTDGGIWKFTKATNTWSNLNGDLAISAVNSVATKPGSPNVVLGSGQRLGSFIWDGTTQTWQSITALTGSDINTQIQYVPTNANMAYAVSTDFLTGGSSIFRGVDIGAGLVWSNFRAGSVFAVDANNPNRLVTGTEQTFDGTNFISLSSPVATTRIGLAQFQGPYKSDPTFPDVPVFESNHYDPDTIYVSAVQNIQVTKLGGGASNWSGNRAPLFSNATNTITAIVVDPTNRDTVYITVDGFVGTATSLLPDQRRVFKSVDAGQNWVDISLGLPDAPAQTLALDPRDNTLYLGGDKGVWKLEGGVGVWQKFGAGLPSVQVKFLELSPANNILTAATYGRGVWRMYIGETQANAGAFRVLAGNNVWSGPIILQGATTIGANGSVALQTGLAGAQLTIQGVISDSASPIVTATAASSFLIPAVAASTPITVATTAGILAGDLVTISDALNEFTALVTSVASSTSMTIQTVSILRGAAGNTINPNTGVATLINGNTLTKVGGGDVILQASNTYRGATFVNEGNLVVAQGSALGSSAQGTTVLEGAALQLKSSLSLEPVTIVGNGVLPPYNGHFTGPLQSVVNNNTYTGPLTLTSNTTLGVDAGSLTVSSPLALNLPSGGGAGALTVGTRYYYLVSAVVAGTETVASNEQSFLATATDGAAQLTWTAVAGATGYRIYRSTSSRTYPASSLVTTLTGTAYLDVGAAATLGAPQHQFSITGPGFSIDKEGAGTLNLASANNYGDALTGRGTIVNTGVLGIRDSRALGFAADTGLTTTAPFTIPAIGGTTAPAVNVSADPTILISVGQTVYITDNAGHTISALVTAANATSLTLQTSTIHQGAAGNLLASGAIIRLAATTVVRDGAQFQIQAGASAIDVTGQVLVLSGTGTGTDGALFNVSGNNTWSGNVTLSSAPGFSAASTPGGVVAVNVNNGTALAIAGTINQGTPPQGNSLPSVGTLTSGLAQIGTGTLTLAGFNTYSGGTYVGYTPGTTYFPGGVVNVQQSNALGNNVGREIQRVVTFDPPNATDTFSLSFGTGSLLQTTVSGIATNATAGAVQLALNSVPNIQAIGGVQVTSATVYSGLNEVQNLSFGNVSGSASQPSGVSVTPVAGGGSLVGPGFYYVVTAITAVGESIQSIEQSTGNLPTPSQATISWIAVPGATEYRVYRSTVSGVYTNTLIVTLSGNATTTYVDTGADLPPALNPIIAVVGGVLTLGQTFNYVVTGVIGGVETVISTERSVSILTPLTQSAQLTWTAVAGASSYRVYRSIIPGNYTNALLTTVKGATSYLDLGFAAVGRESPPGTPPLQTRFTLTRATTPFEAGATTPLPGIDFTGVPAVDANAISLELNMPLMIGLGGTYTVTPDGTGLGFNITFGGLRSVSPQPLITANITQSNASTSTKQLVGGVGGATNIYTIQFNAPPAVGDLQGLVVATSNPAMKAQVTEVATGGFGTLVNPGTVLQLDGDPGATGSSITIPASNILALGGTGIAGAGALINSTGNNTWQGNVVAQSSTSFAVNPGTELTITGTLQDPTPPQSNLIPSPIPPATLTKIGAGTLSFNPVSQTVTLANVTGSAQPGPLQPAGPVAVPLGSLLIGTTYYYVVTALTNKGETLPGNETNFTPAGVNQTARLTWNSVAGATGYRIYRSTGAGSYPLSSLVATRIGSTLTFDDTGTLETLGAPPIATQVQVDFNSVTGAAITLVGNNPKTDADAIAASMAVAPGMLPVGGTVTVVPDATGSIFTFTFGGTLTGASLPVNLIVVSGNATSQAGFTGNTYTGNTAVNAGILNIQQGKALGINRSAIQDVTVTGTSGSFSLAFASVPDVPILASASIVAQGSLSLSVPYYYVVTALTASGETLISNERVVVPTVPGVQATSLTWNAFAGATGYKVYRSLTSGIYGPASLVNSTAATSYIDYGASSAAGPTQNPITPGAGGTLVVGNTYFYYVTVRLTSGETPISPIAAEQSFIPGFGSQTAQLSWSAVAGALGYKIYRATTSGGYGAESLLDSVAGTAFNDVGAATLASSPTTVLLPVGSSASAVQNALNALTNIRANGGSVTVTQIGNTYRIYFNNPVGALDPLARVPQQPLRAAFTSGVSSVAISIVQLGGASTTNVAAGATLQLESTPATGFTESSGKPLTINGSGVNNQGVLDNAGGNNHWGTTPVILGADVSIGSQNPAAGNTLFIDQAITDSFQTQDITFIGLTNGVSRYTLNLGGYITPAIVFSTNPLTTRTAIANALNALPPLSMIGGAVTVANVAGSTYRVTFNGVLAGLTWPTIVARVTTLPGSIGAIVLASGTNARAVTKVGPGTVQYAGAIANAYTGLTTVDAGTLELNKTGANTAVLGNLLIGTTTRVSETQQLQLASFNNGETFRLTINGNQTGPITYSTVGATTAANISLALNVPALLGAGGAAIVTSLGGDAFSVAFGGTLANLNVGTISGAAVLPSVGIVTVTTPAPGGPAAYNADVVRLLANAQISDTAVVTINADGQLDINGSVETIGATTITDGNLTLGAAGSLFVPSLAMTAGTLGGGGTLQLQGPVTATSNDVGPATSNAAQLNLGAATRTFTVNDGPNPTDLLIASIIQGGAPAVGLTKAGIGRLELTAVNTYLGTTTINAGDVQVNLGAAIGNVALPSATGSISGKGSVGTITGAQGSIKPGYNGQTPNTGILNSLAVTMGASNSYFINLDNPDAAGVPIPGTEYDQLSATGNVVLGGALLTGSVGTGVRIGDVFTILSTTVGTISGQFFGLTGVTSGLIPDGGTVFIDSAKFVIDYTPTTVTLTRELTNATISITSPVVNTSVYGERVIYTATILPESTLYPPAAVAPKQHTVTWTLDGTSSVTVPVTVIGPANTSGTATFDPQVSFGLWAALSTHTIDAKFNGILDDLGFNDSSVAQFTQTLIGHEPVISLSTTPMVTPAAPVYGQQITINANVGPTVVLFPGAFNPTGNVSFAIDAGLASAVPLVYVNPPSPDTASVALLPPNLDAGTHTVHVRYLGTPPGNVGDVNYVASVLPTDITFDIQKDSSVVAFTATTSPTNLGDPAIFTVQVTPGFVGSTGVPTGDLTLREGAVVLGAITGYAGGPVSFPGVTSLTVGVHTIDVDYTGDANYTGGTKSVTYTVDPSPTTTAFIPPTPASIIFGAGSYQLSAHVTSNPTFGSILGQLLNFWADGTVPGPGVTNLGSGTINASGDASISVLNNTLVPGPHTLYAVFNGFANFAPSTATQNNFNVASATSTGVIALSPSGTYGIPVTYRATITPAAGVVTDGILVTFVDSIDGTLGTALTVGGVANFAPGATQQAAGTHTITANFAGNSFFTPSSGQLAGFVINKAVTSVVLTSNDNAPDFGEPITLTAVVTATSGGTPTTSPVTFSEGATVLGTANTPISTTATTATYQITNVTGPFPVGSTHTLTATYATTTNFSSSSNTTAINPIKAGATITTLISSLPISFVGNPIAFTATVQANLPSLLAPAGTVNFYDGAAIPANLVATGTLNASGVATSTPVSTLTRGTHTITAVYQGNGNFNASPALTMTQEVLAVASVSPTLAPNPAKFGQSVNASVIVTGNVGAPTGTVTVKEGAVTLGSGLLSAGSVIIPINTIAPFLPAGSHPLTIEYGGDATYFFNSAPTTLTVDPATTTTAVSSSTGPSIYGQAVQFQAVVTALTGGTPTNGIVTFFDGGVPLGTGGLFSSNATSRTYQFTTGLVPLGVGNRSITATYTGTADFAASTSPGFTQIVSASPTTTTLAAASSATLFGQFAPANDSDVGFMATVISTGGVVPDGNVTFFDGGVPIGTAILNVSGVATLKITTLPVGTHNITATFIANNEFSTSTTSAPQVHAVSRADTQTTVTSSAVLGSVYGQPVTFTITVASTSGGLPPAPTGTVELFDGGSPIASGLNLINGQASFTTVAFLSVANHAITASYATTASFNSSTSSIFTQPVAAAATTTTLSSNPGFWAVSTPGNVQTVTFTATVEAQSPSQAVPTGNVIFTIDGVDRPAVALASGKANLNWNFGLPIDNHTVSARFELNTQFLASVAAPQTQLVRHATTLTLVSSVPDAVVTYPTPITFSAVLTSPGGIPGGIVQFFDNNVLIGTANVAANGVATFVPAPVTIDSVTRAGVLAPGIHSITAVYLGQPLFNPAVSPAPVNQTVIIKQKNVDLIY